LLVSISPEAKSLQPAAVNELVAELKDDNKSKEKRKMDLRDVMTRNVEVVNTGASLQDAIQQPGK
jgi:CBS-domain-containing membrane protein